MSQSEERANRTNSTLSRRDSPHEKRQDPQQQLSQIEKSVTHLLVATKQLLETLTQWSRGTASENEVSDVYVRLGYEFNIACRTFGAIGIETSDLGPVPDLLRDILEETLSQQASQASLDQYLPRIRDIIIALLQGLKRKQQKLRQKNGRSGSSSDSSTTRQGSIASASSANGEDDGPWQSSRSLAAPRQGSAELARQDGTAVPPRTSSFGMRRASLGRGDTKLPVVASQTGNTSSQAMPIYEDSMPGPTMSSHDMHDSSAIDQEPQRNTNQGPYEQSHQAHAAHHAPPRPPHKQQDALAALQRGGELERRASRRFSTYQIQKHLGSSTSGIPMMPPTQHSPVPNRGRDVKDSMNAVRVRSSFLSARGQSRNNLKDSSPGRFHDRISEEDVATSEFTSPRKPEGLDTPIVKTPEDKLRPSYFEPSSFGPSASALQDNLAREQQHAVTSGHSFVAPMTEKAFNLTNGFNPGISADPSKPAEADSRPQRFSGDKELTLFLQYKTRIKKFVLAEGYEDLSIARLQLAFIEKFAWNAHSNGDDLPEIYLQDPLSGIRHELEDLTDIKDRSVLVLNVDPIDEVKRHVDKEMGGLKSVIEGVKAAIDDQLSVLQRVSDKQQDTARDLAQIIAAPPASPTPTPAAHKSPMNDLLTQSRSAAAQLAEVQGLRRDLTVMRQKYSTFVAGMEDSMSAIRAKASTVKSVAVETSLPAFEGESGRAYVNAGKKTLSDDSERIINRVDDLQDIVEDLRKDVVTRGVRPLPRQLESVSKDISVATAELKKLQEYIRREKPAWTKIWKNELQVVCDDQNFLTMQEELAVDLEDDLDKAAQTFALVEQATKQQNFQNVRDTSSRSTSRSLNGGGIDIDPQKAKDGVLGEVRALHPNHETRLEAIERAEKARQRELERRDQGEFKQELGTFIEQGKLKKSGGFEEAERLRELRDDQIRKEVWERQNGVTMNQELSTEITVEPRSNTNGDNDNVAKLDVPARASETGGSTSPEPEFVEAVEEPPVLHGTIS